MASLKLQKLEADEYIKAPAKQFFDVFCHKTRQIANVCPDKITGVDVKEGPRGFQGSIVTWHYVQGGKKCVAKDLVESVDKENNKLTFKVLEGDLMEDYKDFKLKIQVFPQENGSVVHWTLEYEKLKDNTPDPHALLQLVTNVTKEIGAHLALQTRLWEEQTTK